MPPGCPRSSPATSTSAEEHEGYRTIVAESPTGPQLRDAYRVVHPDMEPDEATFHNFSGNRRGRRIDFVLGTAEFRVTAADIERTSLDGRYPSDHFPVTAVLELPPAAPK